MTKRTFFEQDDLKDRIEKTLYNSCGILSNAVVISGPNCERHIRNLRESVCVTRKSRIIIPEIDKDTHILHKKWLESKGAKRKVSTTLNYRNDEKRQWQLKENVELYYGDVINVPPERFMDIDLMGTLRTQGKIVDNIIDNQMRKFRCLNLRKGIIFTFSARGTKTTDLHNYLKKLVKTKFNTTLRFSTKVHISPNYKKEPWVSHSCLINGGRLVQMYLYYYKSCNGCPMFTGMLVYK